MLRYFIITLLSLLIQTNGNVLFAQQSPAGKFEHVRYLSSEKNYDEAILELHKLISEYPENLDYQIYLGRVYSWAGKYDEATSVLQPIVKNHPQHEEALSVLIRVYLWAGEYQKVIDHAELGISRFDENQYYYQQLKLQALKETGSVKQGLALVDTLKRNLPLSESLLATETNLLRKQKNSIGISYTNTYFKSEVFNPWHLGSLSYTRAFRRFPAIFRVNYANFFNKSDGQIEVDLYPEIGRHSYLYFNLGLAANSQLFPSYRGGIELFHELPTGISFSGGARLLNFTDASIPMVTGHVGKTWNEYRVQYRPMFVYKNSRFFPTHAVAIRKNWMVKESFLQLDLQYGTAPYFLFITEDFDRVSSKRIGLQSQVRLEKNLFLRLSLMYEYEEYSPENFRSRLNSQMILRKRF